MTDSRTPRPHRPDPIAWGAVETLAGRAQTIAKGWLLLLLERAPLDAAGAIPAAALAAEGPGLSAAFARGLGSDVELARLGEAGDLAEGVRRLPLLAGARDATETVAAVDALRACVWEAALDGPVDRADPAAVAQLAARLAAVTAAVAATALAGAPRAAAASPAEQPSAADPPSAAEPPPAAAPSPLAPPTPQGTSHAAAAEPPPFADPSPAAAPSPAAPHGTSHAASAESPPFADPSPAAAPSPAAPGQTASFAPPPAPATASNGHLPNGPAFAEPGAGQQSGPTLHDLRGDDGEEEAGAPAAGVTHLPPRPASDPRDGPAGAMDDSDLWISTLERHIDRCQREGGGLALLRVELVDGDRVAASAPEGEAHVPYGRLAQAIRRAIRRQDLVASDHQGRAWVIAPGVGRAGAIALAERIGAGVENGESWQGAPLAATIGFAVYGEDGQDAATLIDRAEEAMLAATAAGVRIGEAVPQPDGDPDRPGAGGPRLLR